MHLIPHLKESKLQPPTTKMVDVYKRTLRFIN